MQTGKFPHIKTLVTILSDLKVEILFSFIFTAILTSGYLLTTYSTIDVTPIQGGTVAAYVIGSLIMWVILAFGLAAIKQQLLQKRKAPKASVYLKNISNNKLWLFLSLAIFICYIPVILTSVSMLSPDSWSSIRQTVGDAPFNNANPIIFTAFVGIFISLGRLFSDVQFGTFLFSCAQSAILAVIFARIIVWMRQEKVGRTGIVAAFLFYAVLPVNSIAGLIMWKDILFAGFGLLFLLLLRKLYLEKDSFFTAKKITLFIILGFLFCTWRSNGLYAYALFAILAIAVNRKTFINKRHLLLLFSPIVITLVYLNALTLIITPSNSQAAMVIVPSQQIARAVKYGSGTISPSDKKAINEIFPYDQLDEKYNPSLSDPVMGSFKYAVYEKNEGKYDAVWFHLLESHTRTFIAAFLYNTYGYVYPLYLSPTPTDILLNNANHPNALKGYTDSAYSTGTKITTAEFRDLIMKPVPFLHNVGFYTCVILFGLYVAIIRKKRELIGVFILLFCLFVSTILGPVNGEFRYLYLFVVAAPFVIVSAFSEYTFNPKKGVKKRG